MLFQQSSSKGLNQKALYHVTDLLNRFVEEEKVAGCSINITRGGNPPFKSALVTRTPQMPSLFRTTQFSGFTP